MRRLLIALMLAGGCGGTQTRVVQYAPPIPPRRPVIGAVDMSDVSPTSELAGMAAVAAATRDADQPNAKTDSHGLVRDANADAEIDPADANAVGHTWVYQYTPDQTFQIFTCALENVIVQLAPGERLTTEIAFGDRSGWGAEHVQTGDGQGNMVIALIFRRGPKAHSTQHAQVFTTIGNYDLELAVLPESDHSCMRKVRFRHPARELTMALAADEASKHEHETQSMSTRIALDYTIQVTQGNPRWVPTAVAESTIGDHAETVIQFRPDVAWRRIPALKADGGAVNYFYDDEKYAIHVDGLHNKMILHLGSAETGYEAVEINKNAGTP